MTDVLTSAAASSNSLPEAAQALLRRELDDTERLLWSGQPLPWQLARAQLPLFLFGVPWTAFAIFWIAAATRGGGVFGLFGVPFVLVGLFVLSAPWRAYRGAGETVYALTNRRAVVISPSTDLLSIGRLDVVSYVPNANSMSRSSNRDGSGDLVFSTITTRTSKGGERVERRGFLAIANALEVERLVRREVLSASSTAHPALDR